MQVRIMPIALLAIALALAGYSIFQLFRPETRSSEPTTKVAMTESSRSSIVTPRIVQPNRERPKEIQTSDRGMASIEIDEPQIDETIRVKYQGSLDLPDGISFALTLASIAMQDEDDPEYGIYSIMEEMRVDYDQAEKLESRLIEIHDELTKRVQDAQSKIFCNGPVPKIYGDDVYEGMRKIEQIRDDIAEELYLSFINQLPERQAESFVDWNNSAKLSTTSIRYNHKKYYERHNQDGNVFAANYCITNSQVPVIE